MELPAIFEQDIQSKILSIATRVVIGIDNPIYLSTHSINFDGQYYKPLLLGVPSMRESVDHESRNFKISNVTLKISNYKYQEERFSDLLKANPLINEECNVYWNTQNAKDSEDSLRIFKGYVRRVSHTDSEVTIQLEDLTEKNLHKNIPTQRTSPNYSLIDKYRDVPIPIAFGILRNAPAVLDSGRIVKADSDDSIVLMDAESTPPHPVWGDFSEYTYSEYSPLMIFDSGSLLHIAKEVMYEADYNAYQDSPEVGRKQYYDESDVDQAVSQSGTVKLRPFSLGDEGEDRIDAFQIYGSSKPSDIYCNLREAGTNYKAYDGLNWGGLQYNANVGWETPNRFTADVIDTLTDDDYSFKTLESINGDDVVNNWIDDYSLDYDYLSALGHANNGSFNDSNKAVAQTLIRIGIPASPKFSIISESSTSAVTQFYNRIAINGYPIPMSISRSTHILTRTVPEFKAAALFGGYNATGYGISSDYYYLNGFEMDDDGEVTTLTSGLNFNHIFQSVIDGQIDQHEDYLGDNEIADDKISLINTRLTSTTAAGDTSDHDYGAFVRIRDNSKFPLLDYDTQPDEFEIAIGSFIHAGEHTCEFEAGVGGSFSEIDLFHIATIEFDYESEFYLSVTGRKDGDEIIRNPIDILKHLAVEELGIDENNDIDTDSYGRARGIHNGLNFDFSINKEIKSKKLFEEIAKSTLCYPYFNNQGKLFFASYQPSYSLADFVDAETIKDSDVINFSFNKTKLEQVYTGVKFKYNYNYTTEKYDSFYHIDSPTSGAGYFPSEEELAYNGYADIDDNVLEFESKYIKDDETADKIWAYKYHDYQYQHLICKVKLPLHYIHLDVGDTIKFDKLLGDIKAFGIDYTRMETLIAGTPLNWTAIYPMFFITSINKNLDYIEIEARQIHHLDRNISISEATASGMGFVDPFVEGDVYEPPEYEPEEDVIEAWEMIPSLEDTYPEPQRFFTLYEHQELLTTDVHHWLEPQAFGLSSFDELLPSSWSYYSSSDIMNYKALEFTLQIGIVQDYDWHQTGSGVFVFALENVSGSNDSEEVELAWTLNGTEFDAGSEHSESTWAMWLGEASGDVHYIVGRRGGEGYIPEQRMHYLGIGEGLHIAIQNGVVDLEEFTFYTGGLNIYTGYIAQENGDVNLDGTLNVLDVVSIVNVLLNYAEFNEEQMGIADVNADSTVNILDVVLLVNIILD